MATTQAQDTVSTAPVETKTPFDIAVGKIIEETGRPYSDAEAGVNFIQLMVDQARGGARCNTPGTHHLTWEEMDSVGYAVMDDIMPHGETAKPGTAHAAVETAVLGSQDFAVVHDNPTGRRQDCVVTVEVRSV